jgi:DNA-binding transcriptional LysR family regulator
MNLSRLQYFVKLAELQHYTKTAKYLRITQPTLSNAIIRLEDELGVPLFEREGRNVRLTRYGREFHEYAKQALDILEEGQRVVRKLADKRSDTLHIGTISAIQNSYLSRLVGEYQSAFNSSPTINISQGLPTSLIEGLEDDTYDVIFSSYLIDRPDLCFIPVLPQRLSVLAHADHRFAGHAGLWLADLCDQRIITYRSGTPLGDAIKHLMERKGLRSSAEADDDVALASLVDVDAGAVGLILDTLDPVFFRNLIRIPLQDTLNKFHPVYLVFKTDAYRAPFVERFIDLAKGSAK